MKVLTEADLRTLKISEAHDVFHVEEGTFVTPLAKEFLRDRKVTLVIDRQNATAESVQEKRDYQTMTYTPIRDAGKYTYIDAITGEGYREKPEDMTHLYGNQLIPKTHPRIALRGKLDSLEAQVLLMQVKYREKKNFCQDLGSILIYLKEILGAEVKNKALEEISLFGLNHEEVRHMSHNVREEFGMNHPVPDPSMGTVAMELNFLRTQAREVELCAANAFQKGDELNIIQHLNRLSSGIYILFCRILSGYYER